MAEERPDVLTRATALDVYGALRTAWMRVFGHTPARASVLVLLAQWALETGRGKSCHCWNIGNIKSVAGDGYDYVYFRCNEILGGKEVWFDPPHPACRFRAYATLEDGARDYLATLHRRFAKAWPAVIAGDAGEFAKLLKASRYYTADEGLYTRAMVSLFAEFERSMPADPQADDGELRDYARNANAQAILEHLRDAEDEDVG